MIVNQEHNHYLVKIGDDYKVITSNGILLKDAKSIFNRIYKKEIELYPFFDKMLNSNPSFLTLENEFNPLIFLENISALNKLTNYFSLNGLNLNKGVGMHPVYAIPSDKKGSHLIYPTFNPEAKFKNAENKFKNDPSYERITGIANRIFGSNSICNSELLDGVTNDNSFSYIDESQSSFGDNFVNDHTTTKFNIYFNNYFNTIHVVHVSITDINVNNWFSELSLILTLEINMSQYKQLYDILNDVFVNADCAKNIINNLLFTDILIIDNKLSHDKIKELILKHFTISCTPYECVSDSDVLKTISASLNIDEQTLNYIKRSLPSILKTITSTLTIDNRSLNLIKTTVPNILTDVKSPDVASPDVKKEPSFFGLIKKRGDGVQNYEPVKEKVQYLYNKMLVSRETIEGADSSETVYKFLCEHDKEVLKYFYVSLI